VPSTASPWHWTGSDMAQGLSHRVWDQRGNPQDNVWASKKCPAGLSFRQRPAGYMTPDHGLTARTILG